MFFFMSKLSKVFLFMTSLRLMFTKEPLFLIERIHLENWLFFISLHCSKGHFWVTHTVVSLGECPLPPSGPIWSSESSYRDDFSKYLLFSLEATFLQFSWRVFCTSNRHEFSRGSICSSNRHVFSRRLYLFVEPLLSSLDTTQFREKTDGYPIYLLFIILSNRY